VSLFSGYSAVSDLAAPLARVASFDALLEDMIVVRGGGGCLLKLMMFYILCQQEY